jgi:hypothetical protein
MANSPNDILELAKLARGDIHKLGYILSWIAIPLALIPPVPRNWSWIWLRTLLITVAVWYVSNRYRIVFEVPWNMTVCDIEDPHSSYDGVGGNVAVLFFGWILPFLECLGTLVVCRYFLPLLTSVWRRFSKSDDKRKV